MTNQACNPENLESKMAQTISAFSQRMISSLFGMIRSAPTRRMAFVGAFLAGFLYLSEGIKKDVYGMKRFQVPLTALKVSTPPKFLSNKATLEVQALALPCGEENGAGFSAFDPRLVPTMTYVLEQLPWVEKVESLTLEYPAKIRFALSVLEPTALVRTSGNRAVAVAKEGQPFPRSYIKGVKDEGSPALPLITGLNMRKDGRDLMLSVLALIDRLREQKLLEKANIHAIDVENYSGRKDSQESEIVLVTESGMRIGWGRLEDTDRVHLSFAKKAMKLSRFLNDGPAIGTIESLSLHWDETVFKVRETLDQAVAQR
jgi:hypothetical protein